MGKLGRTRKSLICIARRAVFSTALQPPGSQGRFCEGDNQFAPKWRVANQGDFTAGREKFAPGGLRNLSACRKGSALHNPKTEANVNSNQGK
ncbi:uncharacterized protein FOMMEDRAFT_154600 [Fomitiporia mediterranea MF3/22]|uniref:uncharacterized protein n=1 Tax=Fomitiporia mediterranea (strain MF3/22) TaxID=694068 RepID=UPI0004409200|nr:uncharacterized protein FOMMEDRAFT_154600 [Fomitiporia mediterranea MF3/22]EJD03525.1 hypothetical protein FOMMEDRAFT_154600 [Fomitiporia mediterranea MF3/22]